MVDLSLEDLFDRVTNESSITRRLITIQDAITSLEAILCLDATTPDNGMERNGVKFESGIDEAEDRFGKLSRVLRQAHLSIKEEYKFKTSMPRKVGISND